MLQRRRRYGRYGIGDSRTSSEHIVHERNEIIRHIESAILDLESIADSISDRHKRLSVNRLSIELKNMLDDIESTLSEIVI